MNLTNSKNTRCSLPIITTWLMIPANFSSLRTGRCITSYSSIKLKAKLTLSKRLTAGNPLLMSCDESIYLILFLIRQKSGRRCCRLGKFHQKPFHPVFNSIFKHFIFHVQHVFGPGMFFLFRSN